MLDLDIIENDFYFNTERKIIMGRQGAKPRRLYTGNELYFFIGVFFDRPDMMIHSVPLCRYRENLYYLFNGWTMDKEAKASLRDFRLVGTPNY